MEPTSFPPMNTIGTVAQAMEFIPFPIPSNLISVISMSFPLGCWSTLVIVAKETCGLYYPQAVKVCHNDRKKKPMVYIIHKLLNYL